MQIGFYFDQTACMGCGECYVICQSEHALDPSMYWRKVETIEKGDVFANLSSSCYHCAQPPCMPACPVGAITKREEDGIVTVDSDACAEARKSAKCIGTSCKDKCPYGSPKFLPNKISGMMKCNLCLERLDKGEKPWCVTVCPTEALDAGPLDKLIAKYGDNKKALGFEYSEAAKPSIIFKSTIT